MAPRKKLIEVALPLEAINLESAREKSIRHGHPSTLHLWWARRPLAACRAVLFASLVDDPDSDPAYAGSEDRAAAKRAELFDLIEELVKWDNANNPDVLNRARAEIARCVASRKIETGKWAKDFAPVPGATSWDFNTRRARPEAVDALLAEHAPPVYDPFCGGGSIPLEAQRLGLRAYASDLNPVPVLITKALIEIPPKFAGMPPVNPEAHKRLSTATYPGTKGLAEDVRYYGRCIREEAERQIGLLYPTITLPAEAGGGEASAIAWIWARTIQCPNPACNTETPISKTFALSGKRGNEAYIEPIVDKVGKCVQFKVHRKRGEARPGNVNRRGAECLLCGGVIPLEHIRLVFRTTIRLSGNFFL